MSRLVKIYSGVEIEGPAALNTAQVTDFPLNPLQGTFVTKDDVVWVFQTDNGTSSWQPYRGKGRAHTHTQAVASATWNIVHNLGSTDLWYQIKDTDGNIVFATNTSVDSNNSTIEFSEAVSGSVILLAPTNFSAASGVNITAQQVANWDTAYTSLGDISAALDAINGV